MTGIRVENLNGIPDNYPIKSDNILFNLDFRHVTGLERGYAGKSPFDQLERKNDSFRVITDRVAYCYVHDVAYTPETAVLIAEGERRAWNPGDPITPKDKFVFWRYVRERSIVEAEIPHDALMYYAFSNDLISEDNVFEAVGESNAFRFPPVDVKIKTLKKIGEEHDFEIQWEKYDDLVKDPDTTGISETGGTPDKTRNGERKSNKQSEKNSNDSSGSGEQTSANESTATERASSSAKEGPSSSEESQPAGTATGGDSTTTPNSTGGDQSSGNIDEEAIPDTMENEDGVDTDVLFEKLDGVSVPEDTNPPQEDNTEPENDGTTRFQTYNEPDLSILGIDVDANAVAQFIEHHAITDNEANETLKTPTDTMIEVFTEWAEMNDVKLDKLEASITSSVRKGNLTQILNNAFDIEKGQRRIDGKPTSCYFPIALEESIIKITQ